jgi:hypothetical protein
MCRRDLVNLRRGGESRGSGADDDDVRHADGL